MGLLKHNVKLIHGDILVAIIRKIVVTKQIKMYSFGEYILVIRWYISRKSMEFDGMVRKNHGGGGMYIHNTRCICIFLMRKRGVGALLN